jgi:hypothetical protein
MRILCLILASDADPLYVRYQARWRKLLHRHPDVDCYFYKSHPTLPKEFLFEGDTLWVRAGDTLDTVYEKTIAAFSACLPILDSYAYVFRSNLSTLISFPHLLEFCEPLPRTRCCAAVAGGIPPDEEKQYKLAPGFQFPAGNGFLLSPDLVRRLVDERPPLVIQDDVTIGTALQKWGVPIQQFARFGVGAPRRWYCTNMHLLPPGPMSLDPSPIAFTYRLKSDDREDDLRLMDLLIDMLTKSGRRPEGSCAEEL